MEHRVTILVVNWNGKPLLKDCLESLCCQTYKDCEIVLVDNGSTDQSTRFVMENFPRVQVIELSRNTGFTGGNLAGLEVATGDFIALVNNDTRADAQWLEELVQPMLADAAVGICASKLLLDPSGRINSAGVGLTTAAVGFDRGYGDDGSLYGDSELVFGACAAAVLYRRAMLDDIGFLDDDFYLYGEDVDLSFRAQLAGWKCAYVPNAVVYHKLNATAQRLSDLHVYHHTRNLEFVWLKNMPAGLMLRFSHHKLFQEIGAFCYLCLRHGRWSAFLRAKRDALRMLPGMLQKRREIQRRRRVPNKYIRSVLTSVFAKEWLGRKFSQLLRG